MCDEIREGIRSGNLLWLSKEEKNRGVVDFGWGQFKVEYQEQPVTFDEWRSARKEKGTLIRNDKPGGETNTDLNPSNDHPKPIQPTTHPTKALDMDWAIT